MRRYHVAVWAHLAGCYITLLWQVAGAWYIGSYKRMDAQDWFTQIVCRPIIQIFEIFYFIAYSLRGLLSLKEMAFFLLSATSYTLAAVITYKWLRRDNWLRRER